MRTSKRIKTLAAQVENGNRADEFQEFRAITLANGYRMYPGGWVKFGDEYVTRGWSAFAGLVTSGLVILIEPANITNTIEIAAKAQAFTVLDIEEAKENPYPYPTRGLIPEVDAILDQREAEATETIPATVEVSYLYATRVPTVRLSDMTMVQIVITEDRGDAEVGDCQSGAALGCLKTGVRRVLPESLLPGSEREDMIQCVSCFEASAAAYSRKLHHYTRTEA